MAPRSRSNPASREKSAKKRPKRGAESQATTEDFEREDMGIAAKE